MPDEATELIRKALETENKRDYLHKDNVAPADAFVRGPLWKDFMKCLRNRAPKRPETEDAIHVASQKSFRHQGFIECLEEIEKLPYDIPVSIDEVVPASIRDQRD